MAVDPRSSRRTDITALLEALSSPDAVRRESAAARLAIAGAAALPGLRALVADEGAPAGARATALRTLAAIDDPRQLESAIVAAGTRVQELAIEAVEIFRVLLHAVPADDAATVALEQLTGMALDAAAPAAQRLAALEALDGLPASLLRPIHAALAGEADPEIAAHVAEAGATGAPASAALDRELSRTPPSSAAEMAVIVREHGGAAPVTALRRAVDLVRAREQGVAATARTAWMAVRAQIHELLARRGSRLALYDLRETLESAAQGHGRVLPEGFLAACRLVGDASCLEAVAALWEAAPVDAPQRVELAGIFRDVAAREGVTRRHAAVVRIAGRRPGTAELLALLPKAKARRM